MRRHLNARIELDNFQIIYDKYAPLVSKLLWFRRLTCSATHMHVSHKNCTLTLLLMKLEPTTGNYSKFNFQPLNSSLIQHAGEILSIPVPLVQQFYLNYSRSITSPLDNDLYVNSPVFIQRNPVNVVFFISVLLHGWLMCHRSVKIQITNIFIGQPLTTLQIPCNLLSSFPWLRVQMTDTGDMFLLEFQLCNLSHTVII